MYKWALTAAAAEKRQRDGGGDAAGGGPAGGDAGAGEAFNADAERALLRVRAKLEGAENGEFSNLTPCCRSAQRRGNLSHAYSSPGRLLSL